MVIISYLKSEYCLLHNSDVSPSFKFHMLYSRRLRLIRVVVQSSTCAFVCFSSPSMPVSSTNVKRPFSTAEVHGIVGPLGGQLQSSTQDNIHVYKTHLQYLYYNVYYILLASISSFFLQLFNYHTISNSCVQSFVIPYVLQCFFVYCSVQDSCALCYVRVCVHIRIND